MDARRKFNASVGSAALFQSIPGVGETVEAGQGLAGKGVGRLAGV